jgi:hypothetical protein
VEAAASAFPRPFGEIIMPRLFLTALATSVALFTGLAHARDGNVPGASPQAQQGSQGFAISTAHKLLKTYLETGNAGSGIVAGFNPYGSVASVTCTNTAGCTIAVSANAQLGMVAAANAAAVCVKIDGAYVNCPYNHTVPAGSSFEVLSYQTFQEALALGTHTVSVEVFSSQPTTLYRFNTEIKLYKP